MILRAQIGAKVLPAVFGSTYIICWTGGMVQMSSLYLQSSIDLVLSFCRGRIWQGRPVRGQPVEATPTYVGPVIDRRMRTPSDLAVEKQPRPLFCCINAPNIVNG